MVRQAVGNGRFDSPEELEVLRHPYRELVVFVNHFCP